MPAFDMPLEKLLKYSGTNPKPQDFDLYWENALTEMHALNCSFELVPNPFTCSYADCFDLYFTGVKGARIHAKYLRPRHVSTPLPTILEFHGYGDSCGQWTSKLALVAEGYCVASLDCRGQGGISVDVGGVEGNTRDDHLIRGLGDSNPHHLLYRDIFLDTAQFAKIIMSFTEVDEARTATMGASQGGALALVCSSLEPRIKLTLPAYPYLSDYKRVWQMDLAIYAYDGLKEFFRRYDPLHQKEDEIFLKLGYIDIQNLVPRIKAQVLFMSGLMDNVCPPSTQFAAYNKITAPKELVCYPDFGHEPLPNREDILFEFISKNL